ncbi:MAG: ABC transporter permease subunit [Rhodospirillum sp.]|nr:ABC transporter permease subunit [Rhodospirillum sp.]MCF8489571.1 ABC transporter permease subunit [Rhodospirillum sp.]MCF8501603.1 ABC transporter permease subunit [Rhodospirillum sp.]
MTPPPLLAQGLQGFLNGARRIGLTGRGLVIAIPLVWLIVFFLIPFLVVGKLSLSEAAIALPPYSPLMEWIDGVLSIHLNFNNFLFLADDSLYLNAYVESAKIAAVSTFFTLLIAYPMAYMIARAPDHRRHLLLMLVVLPFWTSFLLRVYAWIGFLKGNGVINTLLIWLGITQEPLRMLQTDFAVYIGIVYTYLPFMILPLYATLVKLDKDYLEASADLGARPAMTFLTVTLPLSLPGVIAGCMLVFIPAVGEYVIPALLGGPDTLMIGRVLWNEFFANRDWPVASAVAIVMLVVLLVPIMVLRRAQAAEEGATP